MISDIRLKSGICTVCGEYLNVILHTHAQKHGYETAEEFINAGKVVFKDENFNKRFKESIKCN